MNIQFSVIIPIYNEAENILSLVEELDWVMHCHKGSWELIFVDDGSTDQTNKVFEKLLKTKPHIRVLRMKRNFGQTNAFVAGVRASRGEWIITLDGDGQNDPRDIPLLIDTCLKGEIEYDIVSGSRQDRQDPWYKCIVSKCANVVRKNILEDNAEDTGCSLKIYRKKSLERIPLFNGMHRFLPALFQIEGFRFTQVPVHHRQRRRGKSKYNLFNRGFSLFFDLLFVYWMRKRRIRYEITQELSSSDVRNAPCTPQPTAIQANQ